jgi:hypothetical protein
MDAHSDARVHVTLRVATGQDIDWGLKRKLTAVPCAEAQDGLLFYFSLLGGVLLKRLQDQRLPGSYCLI